MFHQANLRQVDAGASVADIFSAKISLLQIWVETIVKEYTRLVTWPLITLKHDALGIDFVRRSERDECGPKLDYNYKVTGNKKRITGVTVKSKDNACGTQIPVTFPGPVKDKKGFRSEKIGTDPLTIWVELKGNAVEFELKNPITV
jgi:hypothetical protein